MLETHKKGQGLVVRRVAFWGLAILIIWGGQGLYTWLLKTFPGFCKQLILEGSDHQKGTIIPVLEQRFDVGFLISWGVTLLGCWLLWRLLNKPRSADFLVETDNELKKVTWPSWKDAWRSSVIVVVFVVFLTLFLLTSDAILQFIVKAIL